MDPSQINVLAVLTAALSTFLLGGLWYSPVLFGKAWMRVNGFTEEQLRGGEARIFGTAFVLSVLMSANLAAFLASPETTAVWGATAGLLAGLGWVAFSLAIIALFERRPLAYTLINGGYVTVSFTLMGLILGAWR